MAGAHSYQTASSPHNVLSEIPESTAGALPASYQQSHQQPPKIIESGYASAMPYHSNVANLVTTTAAPPIQQHVSPLLRVAGGSPSAYHRSAHAMPTISPSTFQSHRPVAGGATQIVMPAGSYQLPQSTVSGGQYMTSPPTVSPGTNYYTTRPTYSTQQPGMSHPIGTTAYHGPLVSATTHAPSGLPNVAGTRHYAPHDYGVYRPQNVEYVAPGQPLTGNMRPTYNPNVVPTYEAPLVVEDDSLVMKDGAYRFPAVGPREVSSAESIMELKEVTKRTSGHRSRKPKPVAPRKGWCC